MLVASCQSFPLQRRLDWTGGSKRLNAIFAFSALCLLAGACADFARRESIGFRVLSLRGTGPVPAGTDIEGFRGNLARLALAAARCCAGRPRPAVLFDLLGLARSAAFLPRGWYGPYHSRC